MLSITCVVLLALILSIIGDAKIKKQISHVESILKDDIGTIVERIELAKEFCRNTKGIVSFAMYVILDTIYKQIKK